MNAVTKGDWKLFCERVGEWQERYMDKFIDETKYEAMHKPIRS